MISIGPVFLTGILAFYFFALKRASDIKKFANRNIDTFLCDCYTKNTFYRQNAARFSRAAADIQKTKASCNAGRRGYG